MVCNFRILSFLLWIALLTDCLPAHGQAQDTLRNVRHEIKGNIIEIKYDLEAVAPGLLFRITPYYLDDAGNEHLMKRVRGDAGEGVSAGKDKTIIWEFLRELNQYDGEMRFKLKGERLPLRVAIQLEKDEYKRSTQLWLNMGHIRGERYEIVTPSFDEKGSGRLAKGSQGTSIMLPKLPVGQPYRIRIWDTGGMPAYTSPFTLKRKIPLSVQIGVPALIAGAVLYLILKPGKPDPLPGPYTLPTNGE